MNAIQKILTPLMLYNADDKDKFIWKFFNNLLKRFSSDYSNQKKEVVFYTGDYYDLDADIANIFEMLITRGSVKDKHYLFIPGFLVDKLAKSASNSNVICNDNIDSVSYLHHWSTDKDKVKNISSEVDKLINIITNMSNINMLVLRGCMSAGKISDITLFYPKKIKIISAKKDINDIPFDLKNDFLFQQKKESNTVKTIVKYCDYNNQVFVKELADIPLLASTNKLSMEIEKALALSSKENNLPLLAFSSDEMNGLINKIRNDWLKNKSLSIEEKNILKAREKHTRTFIMAEFPSNSSFADSVKQKLLQNKREIPIKSYAIAYTGYKSGANEIRYTNKDYPKAIKVLK